MHYVRFKVGLGFGTNNFTEIIGLKLLGRLVFVTNILEAIHVYWMDLSWSWASEATRKICFHFVWRGKEEAFVHPWVRWERISRPKYLGGWGLKNIVLFSFFRCNQSQSQFGMNEEYNVDRVRSWISHYLTVTFHVIAFECCRYDLETSILFQLPICQSWCRSIVSMN